VLAIVVPEARSAEEKAAASGFPGTAQEFIRRAKEGYYGAMKGFPDRRTRREWNRRFNREMRANAEKWRYNWHSYWAERAPVHPAMGIVLPFLSLLQGAATVLWICALISLLATGTLLGLALPPNVPLWLAALLLFVAYGILVGPLKAARRSCYRSCGGQGWTWPFVHFLDAMIWLAAVAMLLWLVSHYIPDLREAIRSIPPLAHQALQDIQAWWK
jgi:hypothetical protein